LLSACKPDENYAFISVKIESAKALPAGVLNHKSPAQLSKTVSQKFT